MKNKMIYRKKGWMLTAMLGFCLGGSVAAQTISSDTISYVAYGTQPEWITTGAVSSVKGSALENSFTTNVANTLHGVCRGWSLFREVAKRVPIVPPCFLAESVRLLPVGGCLW